MNESTSMVDRSTTASAVCPRVCVHPEGQSVPIVKKLHLVLPTGTDMTTCPCTGTCSAVGPQSGATHAPEITQPSSSPATTSERLPSAFTLLPEPH